MIHSTFLPLKRHQHHKQLLMMEFLRIRSMETRANFFIISFFMSSVVWGEVTTFCSISSISLGRFSSRIVPFSGLILNALTKTLFKSWDYYSFFSKQMDRLNEQL